MRNRKKLSIAGIGVTIIAAISVLVGLAWPADDALSCDVCGYPLKDANRVSCPDCGAIPGVADL